MPNAKGSHGEKLAYDYLVKEGVEILAVNFKAQAAEIDIIGRLDDYILFVEVKLRTSLSYGLPREAVNRAKQRKIISAAQAFLMERDFGEVDVRFDVIEIIQLGGQIFIEWIKNAF